MSGTVRPLTLYDLLAPEFLAGFSFPSYIDQYLSLLVVSELTMTSDSSVGAAYAGGVLYTGTVAFPSAPGSPPPVTQHTDPSGAVFNWNDISFQFRLRTWRNGSSALQSVVNAPVISSLGLGTYFSNFTPSKTGPLTNSDYPGLQFRLELLVSLLDLPHGQRLVARQNGRQFPRGEGHHLCGGGCRDPAAENYTRLRTAGRFFAGTEFQPRRMGQFRLRRTERSRRWRARHHDPAAGPAQQRPGGVQRAEHPARSVPRRTRRRELLDLFGIGDDFTGIYIQQLQFFYSDADKDFAFNVLVTDAVISFQGQVWLQAEIDLTLDPASHTPVRARRSQRQPAAGDSLPSWRAACPSSSTTAYRWTDSPVRFPGRHRQRAAQRGDPAAGDRRHTALHLRPDLYAEEAAADVDLVGRHQQPGALHRPRRPRRRAARWSSRSPTPARLVYTNTMLMTVATITGTCPTARRRTAP